MKFNFFLNGYYYYLEMKELKEVNAMIEEFMLLANIYTAKKIYQTFPQCSLLRFIFFFIN